MHNKRMVIGFALAVLIAATGVLGASTLGPSGTGLNVTSAGAPVATALNGASGNVLTSHGTSSLPTFDPAPSGFTAGGDLDGSSSTQTVVGIRTTPVAITAPTSQNVMTYDGGTWGPGLVNLASANAVTGTLPNANQAAQNLSGDVTGTTAADLVTGITNATAAALFSSTFTLNTAITWDAGLSGTAPTTWARRNRYGQDAGTEIDFSSSGACSAATSTHKTCTYNLTATTTDGTTWVTMSDGTTNGFPVTASSFEAWGGKLYVDEYTADAGVGSSQNFADCRVTFDVAVRNDGTITFTEQAGSAGGAPDGGDTTVTPISCTGVEGCTDPAAGTGCLKGSGPTFNTPSMRAHQSSGAVVVQVQGITSRTFLWTYTPTIIERLHP